MPYKYFKCYELIRYAPLPSHTTSMTWEWRCCTDRGCNLMSSLVPEPIGGYLRQVWRHQPGGGEDLLQPGRDAEAGQQASQRVVRGSPQVQTGRVALRNYGEDRQGWGKSGNLIFKKSDTRGGNYLKWKRKSFTNLSAFEYITNTFLDSTIRYYQ